MVSENGFVLVSGSERNTFVGSDERQEELTLEPFVVGRYGSKIKSRYMSFNFQVATEYIAKVLWRFNEKK